MAGVGTPCEAASSPERPLSEGLVPSQPALDSVPLHIVGGDPPRVRTTGCGGGYYLLQGDPLDVAHHGDTVALSPEEQVTRPIPKPPSRKVPAQPSGRAPVRRQA